MDHPAVKRHLGGYNGGGGGGGSGVTIQKVGRSRTFSNADVINDKLAAKFKKHNILGPQTNEATSPPPAKPPLRRDKVTVRKKSRRRLQDGPLLPQPPPSPTRKEKTKAKKEAEAATKSQWPKDPRPGGPVMRALVIGVTHIASGTAPTKEADEVAMRHHHGAMAIRHQLLHFFGYHDANIKLLTDWGAGVNPTKEAILRAMRRLVRGSHPGDRFFFGFCGHGHIKTVRNKRMSGLRASDGGVIWQREFREALVRGMCPGARLTILNMACHAQGLLALKNVYTSTGRRVKKSERGKAQAAVGDAEDADEASGRKRLKREVVHLAGARTKEDGFGMCFHLAPITGENIYGYLSLTLYSFIMVLLQNNHRMSWVRLLQAMCANNKDMLDRLKRKRPGAFDHETAPTPRVLSRLPFDMNSAVTL